MHQHHTTRNRWTRNAHALEVEGLRVELEGVPVKHVGVCAAVGGDDDPHVVAGRSLDAFQQGRHEQLGGEEGANDVGSPPEVVAVLGFVTSLMGGDITPV